jgi:ATP-dependent helicase HrpB
MMVRAAGKGEGAPAAALAAILTERDVLRSGAGQRDRDLRLRLDALASAERDPRIDRAAAARAQAQAKAWRARLGAGGGRIDPETAGRLTALAFPERVAMSRGRGSFRMVSGRGATMDEVDALAASPFLAVAALDGAGPNARVHLAAPLTLAEIEEAFAGQIHTRPRSGWDRSEKAVICRMETRLGALVLRSQTLAALDREAAAGAVIEGIREMGLGALPWPDGAVMLRARIAFARRLEPDTDWPAMTDEGLLDGLERWLAPFLDGVTRASHFAHIDTLAALKADLGWERNNRLDALAPEAIRVPSGSFIPIDYAGEHPVLAVRLQEMFGLVDTPTVGRGRVPVTLHLLSPARRPVQVTRDLKSFWANGYPQVKKDLKGRYPKHFWPDDPWTAEATARAKPRPG